MKDRMKNKASAINDSFGQKFPKAHEKTNKGYNLFMEVWAETFP